MTFGDKTITLSSIEGTVGQWDFSDVVSWNFADVEINPKLKNEIVRMVNDVLGPDFFVLYEDKGKPNEHLHVQLKNKKS